MNNRIMKLLVVLSFVMSGLALLVAMSGTKVSLLNSKASSAPTLIIHNSTNFSRFPNVQVWDALGYQITGPANTTFSLCGIKNSGPASCSSDSSYVTDSNGSWSAVLGSQQPADIGSWVVWAKFSRSQNPSGNLTNQVSYTVSNR